MVTFYFINLIDKTILVLAKDFLTNYEYFCIYLLFLKIVNLLTTVISKKIRELNKDLKSSKKEETFSENRSEFLEKEM